MASCELCGRGMKGRGLNVVIEGASMLVCPQCATKFGGASIPSGTRASSTPRTKPSWIGGPEKPAPTRPRKVSMSKSKPKLLRLEKLGPHLNPG